MAEGAMAEDEGGDSRLALISVYRPASGCYDIRCRGRRIL